ncbi:MAG: Glutamate--cysteine ligase [Gemmatimonadetes bacterium]|nr:Glutamate--cysteine ligase [Gemmatimonadota bacterium]
MTAPGPIPAAALEADLRENAFALGPRVPGPRRIGAEVELIPVSADTRKPVPIQSPDGGLATLPLLRRFGEMHCWREDASPYGVPCFALRDGGVISYEPGGQIELSAPAAGSVGALTASLRGTVRPLTEFLRESGVDALSVGIEPEGTVDDLPLQLPGRRYVRLTRFLDAAGTGGTRMMRQTAAFQASLDWGPRPLDTWRLLNAAAPVLVAAFASSPVYRGRPTGERSFRARVWRELDGGRTGIFPCGADPVAEYLAFALAAPAILLGDGDDGWPPFAEWNARGLATPDDWRTHLTTLFPEVRPKGFVEARSIDAVHADWYAAPLVLLAGMTYDIRASAEARELLGDPDSDLLARAGRDGLADAEIGAAARYLFAIAIGGAERLGERFVDGDSLAEARAYFDAYTRRGRSPADDVLAARAAVLAPPAESHLVLASDPTD